MCILLSKFPVGLVMGFYANGGVPGKAAFLLLDVLWFYFTLMAFLSARNRRFVDHKNFMMRRYALTFSAVMLRTWKLILSHLIVIDTAELYVIDAWLAILRNSFFPNPLTNRVGNEVGSRRAEQVGNHNQNK